MRAFRLGGYPPPSFCTLPPTTPIKAVRYHTWTCDINVSVVCELNYRAKHTFSRERCVRARIFCREINDLDRFRWMPSLAINILSVGWPNVCQCLRWGAVLQSVFNDIPHSGIDTLAFTAVVRTAIQCEGGRPIRDIVELLQCEDIPASQPAIPKHAGALRLQSND